MNRIMFVGGLRIAITSALFLLIIDTRELVSSLTVLEIIGISLVGAAKFRMLKT